MATTQRLGIDIVGTDRTKAAFMSAQRSMVSMQRSMSQIKGAFAGLVGGNVLANFMRSMVNINKASEPVKTAVDNLSRAWTAFGLKVGEGGLNSALIGFANTMGRMVAGSDGLATSIGRLMGGAVTAMSKTFEGIGRSIGFVYDNFEFFKKSLYAFAAFKVAENMIMLSRSFVIFISTLRAAGLATGIFTLIQRRMLLFWVAIIAVGAKVTGTFEKLTDVINQAFEQGSKLIPLLGEGVAQGLNKMGFDVRSLTGAFESYETSLAGIAPLSDTATASTKKFAGGIKALKDEGETAASTFQEVGQVFSSSFSSAFQSIIDRTSSVKDAFSSMVSSILSSLTNLFANKAMEQLFGGGSSGGSGILGKVFSSFFSGPSSPMPSATFGGPKAAGGPVSAGKHYLVGERGPELFAPGTSGSIIPNRSAGAVNLKVNIINQAGVDVQQRPSPDGRGLDVLITNKVNEVLGSGRADKAMRGRFGSVPQKARR